MQSKSTAFAATYQNLSDYRATIVQLTDGVSTWYFSDASNDIVIGSTHIYPLLKSFGGIKQSIDILKKTWSVSGVTVTLRDKPYKMDSSGEWVWPSDELGDIRANTAYIYFMSGMNVATYPTDCLLGFKGIVDTAPKYDGNNISIKLVDLGKSKAKTIPAGLVGDTYSSAPDEYASERIPLVYGEFTIVGDDDSSHDRSGLGLARAIPTDATNTPKCVVSDHALDAITAMYVVESSVDCPAVFISPTLTANDSGDGTATVTGLAYAYVYPYGYAGTAYEGIDEYVTDPEHGHDNNESTAATVKDNYDEHPAENNKIGEATYYINWPSLSYEEIFYQAKISDIISGGLNPDMALMQGGVMIYESSISDGDSDGVYKMATDASPTVNSASEQPDRILISEEHTSGGDGSTDSVTMLKLYWARLRMKYAPSDFDDAYVACKGREYGSWITSRSSNYADGDCIEDPAGIIESILRDELGLTNDDIDQPTFIDAENTSVNMRLNIFDPEDSNRIIKQICEQSTFAYIFTALGTAKLISLSDNTPTTNKTIPYSHILNGKVKVYKSDWLVNSLNVQSRWQEEYGVYRDTDTYNNTTSQAEAWGTITCDVKWPNLAGTSAAHIANHLIRSADGSASDDDGMWANDHPIIEFSTGGFCCADLEIGDWIELDTSCDPHFLLYGATWSSKKFLVYSLQQHTNKTTIKAMKLY